MTVFTKIFLAACMATTMLAGGAYAHDAPVPEQTAALVVKVPPFLSHISMILPPKHTSSPTLSSTGAGYDNSTIQSTPVAQMTTAIPDLTPPVAPLPNSEASSMIHSDLAATTKACEYNNVTTTVYVTISACVSSSAEPIMSTSSPSAPSNSSTTLASTTPASSWEDPSNTATSLYTSWNSCNTGTGTGVPSAIGNNTYHMPTPTMYSIPSSVNTDTITSSQSVNSSSSDISGTTSTSTVNSSTPSKGAATPTSSGEPMFTGAAGNFAGDGTMGLMVGAAVLGFMAILV